MLPNSSTFNTYNICKCHANLCSESLSLRCYVASVYIFAYCICVCVCVQTKNIQHVIQRIYSNMHIYTQIINISAYLIKYIGTIFKFPKFGLQDKQCQWFCSIVFSLRVLAPVYMCEVIMAKLLESIIFHPPLPAA